MLAKAQTTRAESSALLQSVSVALLLTCASGCAIDRTSASSCSPVGQLRARSSTEYQGRIQAEKTTLKVSAQHAKFVQVKPSNGIEKNSAPFDGLSSNLNDSSTIGDVSALCCLNDVKQVGCSSETANPVRLHAADWAPRIRPTLSASGFLSGHDQQLVRSSTRRISCPQCDKRPTEDDLCCSLGLWNMMLDNRYFYSRDSSKFLALGIGIHAILANTSLDQDFRDSFQANAVGDPDAFRDVKYLGDWWVVAPGLAAIWATDRWLIARRFEHTSCREGFVEQWSDASMRAILVGSIPLGILQVAIGSSRPNEPATSGSRWNPFQDENAVSGHAFVGAAPFLVAAKKTDNLLLKSALYAGSGLVGYSRIHDDAHYLSQVLLGWWIANLAAEAVVESDKTPEVYRIVPLITPDDVGIGIEFYR